MLIQKILTLLICLISINSAIGQVEKKTNKLVLKETKDYLLIKDSLSSKQWRQYKRHKEVIDDAILELFAIDTLIWDSIFNDLPNGNDTSDFSDSLRFEIITDSSCVCRKNMHSRMCKSILVITKGELKDSIIEGQYEEPINYRRVDIDDNPYLFTENIYSGNYGYSVGRYTLYSLGRTSFMKPALDREIVVRQEVEREYNNEYTHYVNEKRVEVVIQESVVFNICSYTKMCPESKEKCDTLIKNCTSENYFIKEFK